MQLTYNQLMQNILLYCKDLNDTVTIEFDGEAYPAKKTRNVSDSNEDDLGGVLDDGHFVICVK